MIKILAFLACLGSPTCAMAQYYDPYYDPQRRLFEPDSFYGHEELNRWHRYRMPPRMPSYPPEWTRPPRRFPYTPRDRYWGYP